MLALLATLQPIQNPCKQQQQQQQQQRASSSASLPASSAAPAPPVPPQGEPGGGEAAAGGDGGAVGRQCLAALPPAVLAAGAAPALPPYQGYRGDVLCVLANALLGRPRVAGEVARTPSAVLLLLSQVRALFLGLRLPAVRQITTGSQAKRATGARVD